MSLDAEQLEILEALSDLAERLGMGAVTEVIDEWVAQRTAHDKDRGAKETVSPLTNYAGVPRMKRRCKVDGCEGRVYAEHFYCTVHRLRLERTGDPTLARKRGRKPKV